MIQRLRVLYVEDHAFTRELVASELRAIDPNLDLRAVAGVASAAHLLLEGFSPDVVILDLRLAQGDRRITTGIGVKTQNTDELREATALLYGDRVARRMFEGAAVIRLGGAGS